MRMNQSKHKGSRPLGATLYGNYAMIQPILAEIDFTQSLLIMGEQRSGKSELARNILKKWSAQPDTELLLIGESFTFLKDLPNLHRFGVKAHHWDAVGALSEARNYIYRRQHGTPMLPRLVVAIDDFYAYHQAIPNGKSGLNVSPRNDFLNYAKDVAIHGPSLNVCLLAVAQPNPLQLHLDFKQHLNVTKPIPDWNNVPFVLTNPRDTYEFFAA